MTRFLPLLMLIGCEDFQPVEVGDDGGNAVTASEDSQGRRLETFDWGPDSRNQVVDYVFVVDNSVSMNRVITRVRKSFSALSAEDFPPEARIAVLNTIAPDPLDPDLPHPAFSKANVAMDTPGFGRFVTTTGIREMRNGHRNVARHFAIEGCSEDGWFSPGQTNRRGQPCLTAHTQTARLGFAAEAGLSALAGLLQRNGDTPTFRPGAAVNVIFVSDTHDPGVYPARAADLLTDRPTAADLTRMIEAHNPVSSVRFHAIAPKSECVEQWSKLGPSYFDAARATGGAILDMCTAEDYRPLLKVALDEGARPSRPMLALGADAEAIESVSINGELTTWSLHPTGRAVMVEGLAPMPTDTPAKKGTQPLSVEIVYQRKQPTMSVPVTASPANTGR